MISVLTGLETLEDGSEKSLTLRVDPQRSIIIQRANKPPLRLTRAWDRHVLQETVHGRIWQGIKNMFHEKI